MAGIYLHIPFCKQACHYCNFHFSTSTRLKNDFLPALLKEICLRKDYTGNETIETIYFGGGTPSLLSEDELYRIMEVIRAHFQLGEAAEISFETNPDDIDEYSLASWKKAGINRLSIGVQSFFQEDLEWMHRAHDAVQARRSIELAKAAGFHNMSIDLIYGSPALTDEKWASNVQQAVELGIPHLSCYALTVEPRTALDDMIRKKRSAAVDPETQATQFLQLMDWLGSAGYEHYEISNFALPGKRSRHNSSYWQGRKYLGLGPSAHSFNGESRQWNIANNAQYIRSLSQEIVPFEIEKLTETQKLNEYLMTSLRTLEGIDLQYIVESFGESKKAKTEKNIQKFVDQGMVIAQAQYLTLTRKGKLFADGIAAELFFTEPG
jgi:oxygen-independent coproporphyrinogen-3 oxidase